MILFWEIQKWQCNGKNADAIVRYCTGMLRSLGWDVLRRIYREGCFGQILFREQLTFRGLTAKDTRKLDIYQEPTRDDVLSC
jgi:hypothetical protein